MGGTRYSFNGCDIDLPLILSGGFHNFNYSVELGHHVHATGPEVTYVMKGFAEWHLDHDAVLRQAGGTLALVPQNIIHHGVEGVITPCWLFWYVLDWRDLAAARSNTPFTAAELERMAAVLAASNGLVLPVSAPLARAFVHLLELLRHNGKDDFRTADLRLTLCHIVLHTVMIVEKNPASACDGLVMAAIDYMGKNMAADIAVDDIAAACGLSSSQFVRRFKQVTGVTPADYLQRMRIKTACQWLRQTRKSITDIAFDLGFSSSQYFSSVFHRYAGTTPHQYRKFSSPAIKSARSF